MKRIYLEIVKTIPINFRREWNLDDEDYDGVFDKGQLTWVFEDDLDTGFEDDGDIYFIEDNAYQTNFPRKYFKVIDITDEEYEERK